MQMNGLRCGMNWASSSGQKGWIITPHPEGLPLIRSRLQMHMRQRGSCWGRLFSDAGRFW
ncbi:hypothetical protein D3C75_1210600 [compost metagenome]